MNADLTKFLQLAGEVSACAAALATEIDCEHPFTKDQQGQIELHLRTLSFNLQDARADLDRSRVHIASMKAS